MSLKHDDSEKLSDYAVDLGPLKEIHEAKIAKRMEIEALIAKETGLGDVETLADARKDLLSAQVDQLLEEWERNKDATENVGSHSDEFKSLAQQYYALSQKIIEAQDDQVHEASEHPFDHRLR